MINERINHKEIIFCNALKNTTLRLANYGLLIETKLDLSNTKLAQEFVSYCVYNEEFLKDLIQDELDRYGLGQMSDFNYVFLMNYLSFHLKLDDETANKVADALLSKDPKRLPKDKALELYMMKVYIDDVEVDLHPYFDIIFSLDPFDVNNSFPTVIESAFVKGMVTNSVKLLRYDCFGDGVHFSDKERIQVCKGYIRFCSRFEREIKKDIYEMWEKEGDDDESSWIGFMAYKFMEGCEFTTEDSRNFGQFLMSLPDDEPTIFEISTFMNAAYEEGNARIVNNLYRYIEDSNKKIN